MADARDLPASLIASFDASPFGAKPYRHWLPEKMLPDEVCSGIDALPVTPPKIDNTLGKRETHNSSRLFFGVEARKEHAVCDALASALQSESVVARLERLCEIHLREVFLRIEYCLDTDGFWLEPHTDIGAKLFNADLSVERAGQRGLGYRHSRRESQSNRDHAYRRNGGLIFIPAAATWHGFHRRPIYGVRRSLIVNYVKPEWRNRHELAFPDRPAAA
jgi:hypothetical protein